MLKSIAKSKTAQAKLDQMSQSEVDLFNFKITVGLLGADPNFSVVEVFPYEAHGKVFDILVAQIDCAIFSLVQSRVTGRFALLDFHIFGSPLSADADVQPWQ